MSIPPIHLYNTELENEFKDSVYAGSNGTTKAAMI